MILSAVLLRPNLKFCVPKPNAKYRKNFPRKHNA